MTCIHYYGDLLGSSVTKNPGDMSLSSELSSHPIGQNGVTWPPSFKGGWEM